MIAPASVPQEMMIAEFPPERRVATEFGIVSLETTKVSTTERIEVIQTSDVKRRFKVHLSRLP